MTVFARGWLHEKARRATRERWRDVGMKKVITWEDDRTDENNLSVEDKPDGSVFIHANMASQYTCSEFQCADFVAWVESEILPRYQKAKSLAK